MGTELKGMRGRALGWGQSSKACGDRPGGGTEPAELKGMRGQSRSE